MDRAGDCHKFIIDAVDSDAEVRAAFVATAVAALKADPLAAIQRVHPALWGDAEVQRAILHSSAPFEDVLDAAIHNVHGKYMHHINNKNTHTPCTKNLPHTP